MDIIFSNLLSAPILFFILGAGAGLLKSDLDVPESISNYFAMYLMTAIGFKGGVAIAGSALTDGAIWMTVAGGVVIGFALPYVSFMLLRRTTRLDVPTAAAAAAQYGSVSLVTFVSSTAFLKTQGVSYEGYVVALLAMMEAPAIISGLHIAHKHAPETVVTGEMTAPRLRREIFTNGAILLLLGSFMVGWITGDKGYAHLEGFFVTPFQGILCLFMLDMGLVTARHWRQVSKDFTFAVAAFGIYMPMLAAMAGLGYAKLLGLDPGTGMLFTVLTASASYIAVPAAMRLALPQAKVAVYLPLSIGVTFPFNIIIGIPLYYTLASLLLK